jgi:hypothetical protein
MTPSTPLLSKSVKGLSYNGKDLRFLSAKQQRAANIAVMERRLRAGSINVIVYDKDPAALSRF